MDWLNTAIDRFVDALTQTFLSIEIWRIIVAGIILIVTFAVRKILVNFMILLLKKVTQKTKTVLDDELIDAIDPPARLFIVTMGIYFAIRALGFDVRDETFSGHIIRSMVIVSLFWAIYRAAGIITRLFERFTKKTHTALDDLLVPFVNKGIKIILVVVAISVIAKEWKYDLGALLTGLGLGGLAFALAAQETLANLFGGLTIMLDKPFNVGDWIQSDSLEGTVEDIGFRSTKIRTFAQALVTVPNSTIAKVPVTNWSRMGKRRINFNLGVKYGTTAEQMDELLKRVREMLTSHPDIHPQTIFVYFDSYGTNAYELLFYFFTKTTVWQEFLEVKEDVNLKLMHILDELGIEVAIPATSVYFEKK